MKIAFIVGEFPVLSEAFILNQITGLIDRGHKVDIFPEKLGNYPVMHEDVIKYNLLKCTYYQTIPINKFSRLGKYFFLVISNFHKNPIALLKTLNILKIRGKSSLLNILYKTVQFSDKGHYDIIHCHFGQIGNIGALLKDIGTIKGRLVTTFHGYDMSLYIKKEGNDVYNYLFEKGDMFLPISERWKNELIKLGCDEKKIFVHRMGIDTRKFLFYPRKPRDNGKVQLLTVARLVEKKGVQYGINAVAKVLKNHPDIEYKIVGDGTLRGDMTRLIDELDVSNNIKLLGWKTQEEIMELMKTTDILLAPSVTSQDGDQEGIPVVLMEALAQGIPVLSTYHSGIPELVHDGISGFLVPERDVDSLAERLMYLIGHQEIWAEMGKAGRKYVAENYDVNKLNDQLLELYQRLLNEESRF
ncbi:glycosyltransferase [Candidatus Kuenenia sp.]|uniref:glycosyltransferase n=1 Tax=Candidatus Kuenenia sp. TaxID=2499824 RepID=UPI00321FA242